MRIGLGWKRAIFLCLFLLCFTPLLFCPYNYSAYLYPKVFFSSLLIFLALLFWSFDCLLGTGQRPAWDPAALLLLAFVLWALIRYPWFSRSHAFLEDPLLWGGFGFTYFIARQYLDEERRAKALIAAIGLVSFLICLYGLLQFFGIDIPLYRSPHTIYAAVRPEGKWGRPFSTLGNPSFLGEILAASLPLAIALFLNSERKALDLFWGGLSLMSAFLILVGGVRGAIVAAAAGLLFFCVLERRRPRFRKALILLAAALILLAGSLLLKDTRSALVRSWEKAAAAFSFGESLRQGSTGARLLWWRVSLDMIQAHPLLGTGTGTFREAYPVFQRRFFQNASHGRWVANVLAGWKDNYNRTVEAPHNEFLQTAAETGLPGLLLLLGFLLLLLRRPPSSSWSNACKAGCLSVLIASLFGFPLHLPSTGYLFFLMAGLISCNRGQPAEATDGAKGKGPLFGSVLVLLACLALLQFIHQAKVLASGGYLYRAIGHQLSNRPDQAVEGLVEAKRINPHDPEIDYWLGQAYLSLGHLGSAREFFHASKASFNSPRLYLTLGSIHADLKDSSTAEALYREGIATYPGLAPLHSRLGALYAMVGRYQESLQELERAREMNPLYPETYHFLAHLFHRLGRLREAHQSLKSFLQLAPSGDPRRSLDAELMERLEARLKSP